VGDVIGEIAAGAGAGAGEQPSAPAQAAQAPQREPDGIADGSDGEPPQAPGGVNVVQAPPQDAAAQDVKASPAARRMADEAGMDLSRVEGTGRGGVVSKPDVVEAMRQPA